MSIDPEAHITKDTHRKESTERLHAFIEQNGGLYEGDMCPECDSVFVRVIDYLEYTQKRMKGTYHLKCTGCGFRVKDIWTTQEVFVWELTQ